ncbi:MAG TPA: SgcJ/EcaC family oxidoreductase [Spongiibacteraceae bacterium]|nr:SgcJ/EcaC family oxidoreductase [Spongiibacteraceae bacterium]
MAAKTPEENHKLFQAAVSRADVDAVMELYTPDAVMTMPDSELRGHAQLRPFFEAWLQAPANVTLQTVCVLTEGDVALEKTRCVSVEADGTQSVSYSTVVLRREMDGQWRICIDFPMSDAPAV